MGEINPLIANKKLKSECRSKASKGRDRTLARSSPDRLNIGYTLPTHCLHIALAPSGRGLF
jgi:hypothetical protein